MVSLWTFAIFFLLAMLFHIVTGSVAAGKVSAFPHIGTEGWYLDLLRPLEAVGLAALVLRGRRSSPPFSLWLCFLFLPVAADILGTFGLLIPHWSGGSPGGSLQSFRCAVDAAPMAMSGTPVIMLMLLFLTSVVIAAVLCRAELKRVPEPGRVALE